MKVKILLLFTLLVIAVKSNLKAQTTLGTITELSGSSSFTTTTCDGDTVELAPTDIINYSNFKWYFGSVAPANQITGVNPTAHVVAVTGNNIKVVSPGGIYILTAEYNTPSGCQTKNDTLNINFTPLPSLVINTPATVCSPGSVDLTAPAVTAGSTLSGGSLTYWRDAGATTALTVPTFVNTSGTYYIKVETPSGCTDIKPVSVTISPLPSLTITNPTAVCAPGTVDIMDAAITAGSTLGGGSLSFWSDAGATSSLTSPNAISTSGTYYIKVTTPSGCIDIKPVTVTINGLPTPNITGITTINAGSSTTLTASGGSTYNWNTSATSTSITVSPTITTTYFVTVTNASGCSATANIIVNVNTVNPGNIGGDQTVCSGSDPTVITDVTPGTGTGTITYRWEQSTTNCLSGFTTISGETSASYDPPAGITQTTYLRRVTISTLNSVSNEANSNCITITVNQLPDFTLSHPVICPGEADYIQVSGLINVVSTTGSLRIDSGSLTTPIPNNISGLSAGSYNATVRNVEGCETTKSFTINPTQQKVNIPLSIIRVNR